MKLKVPLAAVSVILLLLLLPGCGGGNKITQEPPPTIKSVTIQPSTAQVTVSSTLQFSATVTGTGNFDTRVSWFVNDVAGGGATTGTISSNGLYTAPAAMLSPNLLTVKAQAMGDSSKTASSAVTLADVPFRSGGTLYPVTDQQTFTLDDGSAVLAAKDELLVFAVEDLTSDELNGINAQIASLGGVVVGSSVDMRTIQVRTSTTTPTDFITAMKSVPGVASASLNLFVDTAVTRENKKPAKSRPATPRAVTPSCVSFPGSYWTDMIGACDAWSIMAPTSADGTLAIVDTGIGHCQTTPPGGGSCETIIDESRLQRFDENGNAQTGDDTPTVVHGSFVAGMAAGNSDSPLFRGVALQNQVKFIDVMHDPTKGPTTTVLMQAVAQAFNQGANAVNISYGFNKDTTLSHDQQVFRNQWLRDLFTPIAVSARAKNRMVVFAAGNTGTKDDDTLFATAAKWNDAARAAWSTNVLRVAAVDSTGTEACFSDMGGMVDLGAPGVDVSYGNDDTTTVTHENGTSFAAPLVTGTAALIRDMNPDLTAPEIRYILLHDSSTFQLLTPTTAPTSDFCQNNASLFPPVTQSTLGPNRLLNTYFSLKDAKSTSAVKLESMSNMQLVKDQTTTLTMPVTLSSSSVPSLDVVFLVDTTGSYADDIATLQSQASQIIDNLAGRGVDLQIGVASFADFPFDPYGDINSGDAAFYFNQALTSDFDAVKAAINMLNQPMHYGEDGPESQYEALYQTATGLGRDLNGNGSFADRGDIFPSNMGWRTGSFKVVILATDAPFHDPLYEPSYPEPGVVTATSTTSIAALLAHGIRVIGLNSGDAGADLTNVVNATGGEVFDLTSGDIAGPIAQGITDQLQTVTLTVENVSVPGTVLAVSPASYSDVHPGDTKNFSLTLTGTMRQAIVDQNYDVILWVRADNSAIVKRVRIPITVPHQ